MLVKNLLGTTKNTRCCVLYTKVAQDMEYLRIRDIAQNSARKACSYLAQCRRRNSLFLTETRRFCLYAEQSGGQKNIRSQHGVFSDIPAFSALPKVTEQAFLCACKDSSPRQKMLRAKRLTRLELSDIMRGQKRKPKPLDGMRLERKSSDPGSQTLWNGIRLCNLYRIAKCVEQKKEMQKAG